MDLNGKTAIITGGANGIGLCIARCLLDNGVSVSVDTLSYVFYLLPYFRTNNWWELTRCQTLKTRARTDMDLNGKTAIITGGANRIGLCVARCLLDNGVSVALLDRDKEKGEETKKQLQEKYGTKKVEFFICNVTDKDEFQGAVKEAVDKFSKLDIFVNNAGITKSSRWEDVIEINLIGTIRGAEEATKYMSKESGGKGGVIVNISSIIGLIPYSMAPPYSASKHAVIGFTRSMGCSEVYDATGIRHIAVCPGITDTDLARRYTQEYIDIMAKALSINNIKQKPENVGVCVLEAVRGAPTGSIWVAEDNEPGYEISIPFYKTMRKTPE